MVLSEEQLDKPAKVWILAPTTPLDDQALNSLAKTLRLYPNRVTNYGEPSPLIAERYGDKIAVLPENRLKTFIENGLFITSNREKIRLNFSGEDSIAFETNGHRDLLRLLILRALENALLQKGYLIDERGHGAYKYIFASQYINGLSTELFEVFAGMTLSPAIFPSSRSCVVALRVDAKCRLVPKISIKEELQHWREKRHSSLKGYAIDCSRNQWLFDEFSVYDVCPLSPNDCPSRANPFKPCKLEHDISQPRRCAIQKIDFTRKARESSLIVDSLKQCQAVFGLIDESDPLIIVKFGESSKEYSYPPARLRRVYQTDQVRDLAIIKGMDEKRAKRERSHASKLVTMKPWIRLRETKRQLDEIRKVPFGDGVLSFPPLLHELEVEEYT